MARVKLGLEAGLDPGVGTRGWEEPGVVAGFGVGTGTGAELEFARVGGTDCPSMGPGGKRNWDGNGESCGKGPGPVTGTAAAMMIQPSLVVQRVSRQGRLWNQMSGMLAS